MKKWIWINGRFIPESQASISVFNSAYLYGIGIFETMKALHGRVLFWEEHHKRFRRNARIIGIKIHLSSFQFKKEFLKTLKRHSLQTATLRMMLSEEAGKPHLVMITSPFVPYPEVCYQKGAKTVLIKSVPADTKSMSRIKTTSYLTKMLARREAVKRKAHEGILVNERGLVTEGASSNFFILKKGILLTTPLPEGLLPGTRRVIVLQLARALKIPIREKPLSPRELWNADEMFLTSSLKDIMPVLSVDGKKIGSACPGPITQSLIKKYQERIRS